MNSHRPSPAAILIVPVIAAVVLTLFAWPNARLEPRDLPIGVTGAPAGADRIERQLATQEGAFDVHRYATEDDARTAIEDREVYGAFVASPAGPKVLTATAASPAVSQLVTHAASEMDATVDDVVPADPRISALPSSVLPIVIAGILTGLAAAALGSGAMRRLGLLAGASALVGLAATAIVQGWLGVIGGDWVVNAGVLGLTVLAIAAVVCGLEALFGKAGVAAAALTMVFVGNPFSGVATGPYMLPEPAGALGQLLPPGAGGNLLRSTGLFDGAAAGTSLAVLAAWALAGLAAVLVAGARRRPAAAPALA
jgi:hypothetical protein